MFTPTPDTFISRDPGGTVRHLEHIQDPYTSAALAELAPEALADEYLRAVAPTYQINAAELASLGSPAEGRRDADGAQIHRAGVKEVAGSIVVDYGQSYDGFPVWEADFSVHIAPEPMRVTSSTSTLHDSIVLNNDLRRVAEKYERLITPASLSKMLGVEGPEQVSKINGMRVMIYRYDPAQRVDPAAMDEGEGVAFGASPPTPPLPAVPELFVPGGHYAIVEVLFDLAVPGWQNLHWRALVEPLTGVVLYLRALVACATGLVFKLDPISLSGNPALTPAANEADLNVLRASVPLTELVTHAPQDLSGTSVDLQEIESPVVPEPKTTAPFNFAYSAKSSDFAAVNAYYHVNWFFNLMRGMGFNLASYFDGTTFPVPIDPWSLGQAVNAHCAGNTLGNGIGHFCFGVAQDGQSVGIADDVRVVVHEFGHALLWDHVNSPNFGFAHSAGDALAAILTDPISRAPDRFLTFPWPQSGSGPLDRRHDRKVADGWGWFGSRYNTQYAGEQVLSTTLFRLYQAAGGDSPHPADRAWASRYIAYLIIKAIGTLTVMTNNPEVFVTALRNADLTTTSFEGHPGGALHKVIRWAFEKQGLYQPLAQPGQSRPPYVSAEGTPPAVDVYIDDGRHGEYQYMYAFWESPDMWVRRTPDGGTTHQSPAVGQPNYMYVRVKNRGSQPATNVAVRAFHCNPGAGLAWPDHWVPMDTALLKAAAPIQPGGEIMVGPFKWTPEVVGHECLLAIASATGDMANDTTVHAPIPHSRFVPFDNNIGQRNVQPVVVPNWKKLLEALRRIRLVVVNPFNSLAQIELQATLPSDLRREGYRVQFHNAGGQKFRLGAFGAQDVIFSVVQGPEVVIPGGRQPPALPEKPGILTAEERLEAETTLQDSLAAPAQRPALLRIVTLANGQNMGGVTFVLSRSLRGNAAIEAVEDEEPGPETGVLDEVDRVCEGISSQPGVKSVKVRRLILEVELENQ